MKLPVAHWRGDAPTVAADPTLPCVTDVLHEDRLIQALGRAFPERMLSGPTEVLDVSYLPRRRLSASFLVSDLDGPEVVTVLATPEQPLAAHNGTRPLDAWNATAMLFPSDQNLAALPRLCDQEAMSGTLRWLTDREHTVRAVEVVRYVPTERCALLLHADDARVFCRTAALGFAHEPATDLTAVWEHPDRRFDMAQPVGFEGRLNTRFEFAAAGDRADLMEHLSDETLRKVADALANLHELGPDRPAAAAARRMGVGAALGRLDRTSIRKLRLAFPGLADRLVGYLRMLREASADLPERPEHLLHGNAHPGNVVIEDVPALVGLDTPVRGDPAFDLALFSSGLLRAALEQGRPVAPVARLIERLRGEYSEVTGDVVPATTYAWWVAACLVGWHADAALEALCPNAQDLTGVMIELAEAVLRGGATGAALTSVID